MQYVVFLMNETMVISYGLKYIHFFTQFFFEKNGQNRQKWAKNGKFGLEKGLNGQNLHFFWLNLHFSRFFLLTKMGKNGQNGQK